MEQLVWARMRFCNFWPAKIVETPPMLGKTPANKVCVLFFGTKNFGFVDRDKIKEYSSHRAKFVTKGKGRDFQVAVQHMDEYISNPRKFRSHAFVQPFKSKIPIKTEKDIRRRIKAEPETPDGLRASVRPNKSKNPIKANAAVPRRIKVEPESPNQMASNHSSQENQPLSKAVATKVTEKQKLIEKIANLQKENQRLVHLSLKDKEQQRKIDQEQSDIIRSLTVEISEIRKELKEAESTITLITRENSKSISDLRDLRNENRLLHARVKQLQSTPNVKPKQHASVPDSGSDGIFEMDRLVSHRKKRDGLHFLVRWKNYTENDDTWEPEKNIKCLQTLNEYKKQHRLGIHFT